MLKYETLWVMCLVGLAKVVKFLDSADYVLRKGLGKVLC